MNSIDYPIDGIIFDCNGTLVSDAPENGQYVPKSNMCRWVKHLSGILSLAIGSGGTREETISALEDASITAFFAQIVTFSDVTRNKPAPDIFLEASKRLGISPDRLLVVGDSENDGEAANQANMRFIHASEANRFFLNLVRN